jgi:YidC/Oxa1 family membrane protein insertase
MSPLGPRRHRSRPESAWLATVDNQRVILFFALSVILLLIWQAWQREQVPPPAAPPAGAEAPSAVPGMPSEKGEPTPPSPGGKAPGAPAGETLARGERIRVVTDVFDAEIDTIGGDLRQVMLRTYPVSAGQKDQPFPLMEDKGPRIFIAQSGLLSDQPAPDHYAHYTVEQKEYDLPAGVDEIKVPLHWQADGIRVTKIYTFHRNSYMIDIEHQVTNDSSAIWKGYQYEQFQRTRPTEQETSRFIYTYIGPVISTPEKKYEKVTFDQIDKHPLDQQVKGGWAAMLQHYFLGVWLPAPNATNHFYAKTIAQRPYVLGLISEPKEVEPGTSASFSTRLYVGPKDQKRLGAIDETLKLTVDYGVLTFLAEPLFWLLKFIHGVVQNWGWSIVLLTLLVKLAFYKLSETSYRSMANMRRVTPKIAQIRERYADDRQRMSQAMMDLYKKEKINPLGGCLPILIQVPVFIALYWVLLESIELRQAPFIFWIHDLSIRDPYYVLPLLMGITMFLQQRLNPPPPDPVQAKVLKALPVVFTLFFAFFPAGLVLYWLVNSALSILQQWYITRRFEQAAAAKG